MFRHDWQPRLAALFDMMRQKGLRLAFEMVTASHGHHGQLPAAEYMVTDRK
jgi:hypothetical protein